MYSFKLSQKAVEDLIDIGRYTTKIWGASQRNKYLKQIDDCFAQLSKKPTLGIKCDYVAKGYRKVPQGSHMIFYKLNTEDVVEIIRVLHKSMDVNSQLKNA